jgi:hypothetical protein
MANATVRDDLMAPTHARNLAATTAAVLHLDATNGGIAPPGVNHLPCQVVSNAAAAVVFTFLDATATTVTVQLMPGIPVRMAPKEVPVGNAAAVTIFWNPEP